MKIITKILTIVVCAGGLLFCLPQGSGYAAAKKKIALKKGERVVLKLDRGYFLVTVQKVIKKQNSFQFTYVDGKVSGKGTYPIQSAIHLKDACNQRLDIRNAPTVCKNPGSPAKASVTKLREGDQVALQLDEGYFVVTAQEVLKEQNVFNFTYTNGNISGKGTYPIGAAISLQGACDQQLTLQNAPDTCEKPKTILVPLPAVAALREGEQVVLQLDNGNLLVTVQEILASQNSFHFTYVDGNMSGKGTYPIQAAIPLQAACERQLDIRNASVACDDSEGIPAPPEPSINVNDRVAVEIEDGYILVTVKKILEDQGVFDFSYEDDNIIGEGTYPLSSAIPLAVACQQGLKMNNASDACDD